MSQRPVTMLFSLPVLPVDSVGAASLNQTFGWGCESGDAYGSGTSFDGTHISLPRTSNVKMFSRAPRDKLGDAASLWRCGRTSRAGHSAFSPAFVVAA